ncbi:MCE family protein [Mycobacterium seoulense]|uniref:MCE family protein n=1 Tax=Mycobacterium seoulense TaxID=386911 RepID=UPI003CEF8993
MLSRKIKIQLIVFFIVAVGAMATMGLGYVRVPAMFGVGQYRVKVQLSESGNLYANANVTYRGTEVGRVTAVRLTDTGVEADLSLRSDVRIPSDLDAQVHSQSAIGEQYVALLPRNGASAPLRDGDVIARSRTSVPPDISSLLDAANRGVRAIPNHNLKTVIDESYTAFGGMGPELSEMVTGASALATDAKKNLDALTTLIDGAKPLLDSQSDTSDAVQAWAAHLATITGELQTHDGDVAGLIHQGGPAAAEGRRLFDRLNPTLPIILANLVSVGQVAVVYHNDIEQLLVLLPQGIAQLQGIGLANLNTKQDYRGAFLSFKLNLNLPPVCTTGFLPAQQRRVATFVDAPDRPAGDVYCRTPQDAMWNPRGARNIPCETVPGKRAPTVKMCESDQEYVPLNDGNNWKGDPNATLSGQGIPQLPPETPQPQAPPPPPAPALAAAEYDPATGTYVGPDGNVYTQADLAQTAPKEHTWQSMLIPPGN